MQYRGKEYSIVQGIKPGTWKWTVRLDENNVRTGVDKTRPAAMESVGRLVGGFRGQSGNHMLVLSSSQFDPGCVKTCASRERAELFSPFSSFDHDGQCCSFLIQRNRDKLST